MAAAAISDFRHHREGVLLPKGHSVSPATAGVLCTPDLCGRPLDAGQALLRVGKRWRKTTGSGEPSHSRRPRRPPADTVCTAQAQVADGGGAGRAPAAQAARAAAISRKHQCLAASNPRLDARLRRDLRTPRAYAAPRGLDAQSTMSSDGEDSSPRAAGMKVRLHAGGSPRRAASASPERAPAPRCAFGRAFR
eukprot:COSAG06_NODE_21868_length_742_cov_2.087092_1_plen_193_part_00